MAISMPSETKTTHFLEVKDLLVKFPIRKAGKHVFVTPVDHVSFSLEKSEVLSVVGESGSGKSTIGRALVRINEPSHGKILFEGQDVAHIKGRHLSQYRQDVQMIFQDPFGSLNPVKTIEKHLTFPLQRYGGFKGADLSESINDLLNRVGLNPVSETRLKYPHELSGGQRQRVSIARALAVNPKILVADEPISMLDVSIRASILRLLNDLKREFGLSFLFITHDLASARYFGDRIMVLYGGKVMEIAGSQELLLNPVHPYTKLLLAATQGRKRGGPLPEVGNSAPNLLEGRKGCPFATRCPLATSVCHDEEPTTVAVSDTHNVACHYI